MKPSRAQREYVPNQLLPRLVGCRLYSVTFVMNDSLDLRFIGDGEWRYPSLDVEVWPAVEWEGRVWRNDDLGYGDALRRLAPEVVTYTSERTGDGIRIGFDKGLIHINPTRDEVFEEIALLDGFEDRQWMCWRPTEDSFEHVR